MSSERIAKGDFIRTRDRLKFLGISEDKKNYVVVEVDEDGKKIDRPFEISKGTFWESYIKESQIKSS